MRLALSIICASCFFLATLIGAISSVSLGTALSFVAGITFLIGVILDVRPKA